MSWITKIEAKRKDCEDKYNMYKQLIEQLNSMQDKYTKPDLSDKIWVSRTTIYRIIDWELALSKTTIEDYLNKLK